MQSTVLESAVHAHLSDTEMSSDQPEQIFFCFDYALPQNLLISTTILSPDASHSYTVCLSVIVKDVTLVNTTDVLYVPSVAQKT